MCFKIGATLPQKLNFHFAKIHSLTKVNAQQAKLHGQRPVFEANFSQHNISALF